LLARPDSVVFTLLLRLRLPATYVREHVQWNATCPYGHGCVTRVMTWLWWPRAWRTAAHHIRVSFLTHESRGLIVILVCPDDIINLDEGQVDDVIPAMMLASFRELDRTPAGFARRGKACFQDSQNFYGHCQRSFCCNLAAGTAWSRQKRWYGPACDRQEWP